MTDAELRLALERLRAGDADAFERIYDGLKAPIYTVLLRILGEREAAEDCFQELFVSLWEHPPADVKKPRAWLFQCARNRAIDALRRRRPTEDLDALDQTAAPETAAERLELADALGRLGLTERQIVTLHLNAGLRFREIADMLALPQGTVYSRYKKAIGALQSMLKGDEYR